VVLFTTCMRYTIALETGPDRFLTGSSNFPGEKSVTEIATLTSLTFRRPNIN
jgi:hypothetical protein